MAGPTFSLTVQSLDFDELLSDFRTLARRLLPAWDVENANDPAVFLCELYLQALDREAFFANLLAQESNLITATDRRAIHSHARRLGYVPGTRQPASALVTLTVAPDGSTRTLQPYTVRLSTVAVSGAAPVFFENVDVITITPGAASVTARFAEGQTITEAFASSGRPFQRFRLTHLPVLVEEALPVSFRVLVNSVAWTQVDGFGDSDSNDEHYVLEVDFDGAAFLSFGDNVKGAVPGLDLNIEIRYRVGGGPEGNVAASQITQLSEVPSYASAATNVGPASGGTLEEHPSKIKLYAPNAVRDGGQLNTLDSVKTFLESKLSIARAKTFMEANLIRAVVLTEDEFAIEAITEVLEREVNELLIMGFGFRIVPPHFVEVEVSVRAFALENADRLQVEADVREAVEKWLDPLGEFDDGQYINDFGHPILRSDLGLLLKQIDGVYDYEILSPAENVALNDDQLPTNVHTTTSVTVEVVGGSKGSGFIRPLSRGIR